MKSTESHHPCFLRCHRKIELTESLGQYLEKLNCFFTVLKGTDKIVCVSDYHGITFTVGLDDLFEP